MGHALMENRSGLVVKARLTHADGHAETERGPGHDRARADRPVRITLGANNGYDAQDFVNELRTMNVTPHVAAKAKGSKTVGLAAKTMLRGLERVGGQLIFNLAAYNLVRLPKLLAALKGRAKRLDTASPPPSKRPLKMEYHSTCFDFSCDG
jgi:hypothetical protein